MRGAGCDVIVPLLTSERSRRRGMVGSAPGARSFSAERLAMNAGHIRGNGGKTQGEVSASDRVAQNALHVVTHRLGIESYREIDGWLGRLPPARIDDTHAARQFAADLNIHGHRLGAHGARQG